MLTKLYDKKMMPREEPPLKPSSSQGKYIKSVVYGGLDGTITTFAVVAGVSGASLAPGIALILGFANLIGDGISMAMGDYLSTKAENEYHLSERRYEEWEFDQMPDQERKELLDMYAKKGYSKKDAASLAAIKMKNRQDVVDVMMVEEHGILYKPENPFKSALATFFSFLTFGLLPLFAYILSLFMVSFQSNTFLISCLITAVTLFFLGAMRRKITVRKWYVAGFEMLLLGGIAALAAYGMGFALAGLA